MTAQVARPWRVLAQGPRDLLCRVEQEGVDFDELVVAQWLHVERMSARDWWVRIGDRRFGIHIGTDGKVQMALTEGDPLP